MGGLVGKDNILFWHIEFGKLGCDSSLIVGIASEANIVNYYRILAKPNSKNYSDGSNTNAEVAVPVALKFLYI